MKDTSIVARIVTTVVIILVVVIGLTVLLKKDTPQGYYTPVPTSGPAPTMTIYPNNGKE